MIIFKKQRTVYKYITNLLNKERHEFFCSKNRIKDFFKQDCGNCRFLKITLLPKNDYSGELYSIVNCSLFNNIDLRIIDNRCLRCYECLDLLKLRRNHYMK